MEQETDPTSSCKRRRYSLTQGDTNTARFGPSQLIPAGPGTSGEGVGASNEEARHTFLKMVGIVQPTLEFTDEVLTDEDADIISSALNHDYYQDVNSLDKYYTPSEYGRVTQLKSAVCDEFVARGRAAGGRPLSDEEMSIIMNMYDSISMECQCPAHILFRKQTVESSCLSELMMLPETLTDHWGGELACSLLPLLLSKGDLDHTVKSCRAGSPYTVNFLLRMPSGNVFHFTGYPDFTVNRKPTSFLLRFSLRGVGEVQCNSSRSKTDALSQAGIYATGQLQHYPEIMVIVLYKDKSANLAMATLDASSAEGEGSLGSISFQFLERVDPLDLKKPKDLQRFGSALVGTLKYLENKYGVGVQH